MNSQLPKFIDLEQIKEDICSAWLPVEDLGVLLYRKWEERFGTRVENAIVWVKTTEIDEKHYFELLENFFPDGLDEETRSEHSRLFNERYKGIKYHLCEVSRHPVKDEFQRAIWVVGQSRRRVVFNRAFATIPTNNEIALFLNSHWNVFYYELRKRPEKYFMQMDEINAEAWVAFNGEKPLPIFVLQ